MAHADQDPFEPFGTDRTIIKPSAGRGARPEAVPPPAQPAAPVAAAVPLADYSAIGIDASLNPLLSAAAPMMSAYTRIRVLAQHPNPRELHSTLAEGVRRFEATARRAGLPNEHVVAGRYVLCTMLDEAASGTPWGGSGMWASQSLLVAFHNETWGGEKFFQLLARLMQNVAGNRELLELMCVALYLGFEGRYRVQSNGTAQLEAVRERVTQLLQEDRRGPDKELSPHWTGERRVDSRLRDGIPVWVAAAMTGVLLCLAFLGLRIAINTHSDPTFQALQSIDIKTPAVQVAAPPAPRPAAPRLATLLKPEVDAGLVEVRDFADRSVVTIRGDGFFEPGSAEVASGVRPLLTRIANALMAVPGSVMVTGHTDNQPIRSLRHPSNWHLSRDRAESVRRVLAQVTPAERVRAEGRADNEPVQPNDTHAGRARNRRVEIILYVANAT